VRQKCPKNQALYLLSGKRMRPLSANHNEIIWQRVTEVAAVICSVLAWAFVVSLIIFWSQIGDYVSLLCNFLTFAVVCWVCGSVGFLLFVRLDYDSPDTRFSRFWLLCSGTAIFLLPVLVFINCLFRQ
jgi:hypothetical protein